MPINAAWIALPCIRSVHSRYRNPSGKCWDLSYLLEFFTNEHHLSGSREPTTNWNTTNNRIWNKTTGQNREAIALASIQQQSTNRPISHCNAHLIHIFYMVFLRIALIVYFFELYYVSIITHYLGFYHLCIYASMVVDVSGP